MAANPLERKRRRSLTGLAAIARREWARQLSLTHGDTKSPEWGVWFSMRQRVRDPNNVAYQYYGGRGLTVCERWQKYENFLADMGRRPSSLHKLERVDNDKGYSPDNCKWATAKEQAQNRRWPRGGRCKRGHVLELRPDKRKHKRCLICKALYRARAKILITVLLTFSLLLSPKAHAQLGLPGGGAQAVITVPGSVTSDQLAEQYLQDIDSVLLPQILNQDTITATSVTTGGGGGDYTPNSQFISSLDQGLFSGINTQNFSSEFPGWVALPPNSTDAVAIPLTATVLTTYGQALALAQSQEQQLEGEDFSNIETTSANAPAVLEAIQANTEAVLASVQEQQYTRQLLAAILTVLATKAAEELNERAQEQATNAMQFNYGVAP